MHACGGADNGREKRNVVIVSVLFPIAMDLALRCNTQRRVDVLRMREEPVLLRVATRAETLMREG